MGFSAVAIPDIKNEMKSKDQSNLISTIQASSEELSWFGEDLFHNVDIMKIMQPVFCRLESFLEPLWVDILVESMDPRRLFKCVAFLGFQAGF